MSKVTRLGAVLMAAVLLLSAATTGVVASDALDIAVQQGDTDYTVTVEHNGTPVNDSQVNVTSNDENVTYSDDGVTDENGTVTFALPENETNVTITATYNGSPTSITTTLNAAGDGDDSLSEWDGEGPFGQWVSMLVKSLLSGGTDGPFGLALAELVVENNPGADKRSDDANPGGNGEGPPDHAGANDEDDRGPPDHAKDKAADAGADSDEDDEEDDDGDGDEDGDEETSDS